MFKCVSDNIENIPKELINKLQLSFYEVNTDGEKMAEMAQNIAKLRKDTIVKLPFCSTIESEALGSKIKIGEDSCSTRVEEYVINSVDNLENIEKADFNKGRIKEVLKAVSILKNQGEIVCINVVGPITIATSLMDSTLFYKLLRKEKEKMNKFMKLIEDTIKEYIDKALEKGVDIISFADPVGSIDIVGPKVYKEISGKITYNILKYLENKKEDKIVHICGKASTSLEKIGLINLKSIEINNNITYGEALINLLKDYNNIKFIGNWCIKRSFMKKNDNKLFIINLA